ASSVPTPSDPFRIPLEPAMKPLRTALVLASVATCLSGCIVESTGDSSDDLSEAATPAQNGNVFDQAKVCDNLFSDRAAFRAADLQQGVLRWKCGDVDGVTISQCEDNLD